MKKLLLFSSVILLTLNCTLANAQNNENSNRDFVEVSTRVDKQITPDEIYLSIRIDEKDNKGKVSLEEQERNMIKSLKALNLDVENNLTIDDMGSNIKTYIFRKDAIVQSRNYTLKVSTAKEAADAIIALNNLKISNVDLYKTAISKELERKTKDELLTEAAVKAKENAEILAKAVGSKLGKAIYIQNYYSFSNVPSMQNRAFKAMSTMDAAMEENYDVSLSVSKTSISINVSCKFLLF